MAKDLYNQQVNWKELVRQYFFDRRSSHAGIDVILIIGYPSQFFACSASVVLFKYVKSKKGKQEVRTW